MSSLQSILEDQFLNKRIVVSIPERDNRAKVIPQRFVQCAGICTYIGPNSHLNWELQVTIDGMPVRVHHINHISVAPITKKIKGG